MAPPMSENSKHCWLPEPEEMANGLQSKPNDRVNQTASPPSNHTYTHAKIPPVGIGINTETRANLRVDQPRDLVQFGQIHAHTVGRARRLLLRRAQILEQHAADAERRQDGQRCKSKKKSGAKKSRVEDTDTHIARCKPTHFVPILRTRKKLK